MPTDTQTASELIQEALAVNDSGHCTRHPNCPVFAGEEQVMSCRVCFSEEKSSSSSSCDTTSSTADTMGQKQKAMAAVFRKIHQIFSTPGEDTVPDTTTMITPKLFQNPQAMERIIKRLTQVQNWELRQKEKTIQDLQAQVRKLEQLLAESEMTANEQTQTIRALRLNIQQDLKIIKTMTLQKQREDDLDVSISSISSFHSKSSPAKESKNLTSPMEKESPGNSRHSRKIQQMDRLLHKGERNAPKPGAIYGLQAYQNVHDDDEDTNEDSSRVNRRTFYWNENDVDSLATDPSMIFRSFRGGLLDIPKSPPSVSHDRQKLKLDVSGLQALRVPSMRSVQRTVSASSSIVSGISYSASPKEIQFDALGRGSGGRKIPPQHISVLQSDQNGMPDLPFGGSSRSLDSGSSIPEEISPQHLMSPSASDDPLSLKSPVVEPAQSPTKDPLSLTKETTHQDDSNTTKPVDEVKEEKSCDKYGETGTYSGQILVDEGLPHGKGKMTYDSGRVYSGDWVGGQWHGQGKLLNPNGDTYEGDFVLDARHGEGIYRWDNGDVYSGSFLQDKRQGKGRFDFHNGNVYEGEFVDGMFEGHGLYKSEIGEYEGEWKRGRYDGKGELRYADGGKYTGEFKNSVAHGFGEEITGDGKKRRGVWEQGKPAEYFERT